MRAANDNRMAVDGRKTQCEIILDELKISPLNLGQIADLLNTSEFGARRPIKQLTDAGRIRLIGGDYELIPEFGGAA